MHFLIFPSTVFCFLLSIQLNFVNTKDVSYNYIFDYLSNVEVKVGEKEYSPVLNYTGQVETSPYILTDNQELILVKLNIKHGDGLPIKKSITGIVIRKKGLVERLIVDSKPEHGLLNLLKGVVNIFSIDEMRRNRTESDVNGECNVVYEPIKDDMLIKEKLNCNKTTFQSSVPELFDSFSIYHDSKIKVHYQYNNEGTLIAVNSFETHLLESVLSEELSQTFKSTTALLLNKVTQSKSMITSATVDSLIGNIFGEYHRDVLVVTKPEVGHEEPIEDNIFVQQYQRIVNSFVVGKAAETTLELIGLLRRVMNRRSLKMFLDEKKSPEMIELIHDAFIGCSTKLCSEIIVGELDRCLVNDATEASRMLLLMQHVTRFSESMVTLLWDRLPKLSDGLYDQALQTISSMVERVSSVQHMKTLVSQVVQHIQAKLVTCSDDHCFQVHLSAARNTKLPHFHDSLASLLASNGKQSHSVTASIYSTLCSLNYNDEQTTANVRQLLLTTVRREINFYVDDRLKYETILCLVRLESDLADVIGVLDLLVNSSDHLNVFLVKKFREMMSMGIISDGPAMMNSDFFRRHQHLTLTYKDESKMLVNQLMSTRSLYSDIHFNVIGQDGGAVRNSMTDIFLVSTARENHILSLATHINGLQSVAGTGSPDEVVDGSLQLVLFGKEVRPIQLFHGTSELMSALWYAPSTLQSLLSGTFVPIDFYREIAFQNGVGLSLSYSGSVNLDFSFRLNSNLWYKTANSLLRVTGQAYVAMTANVKSLAKVFNQTQSLSMKSGLDFDTNIDFSGTQIKNCLSVSRSLSQLNFATVTHRQKTHKHSSSSTEIQGSCYSLSALTNQLCSSF